MIYKRVGFSDVVSLAEGEVIQLKQEFKTEITSIYAEVRKDSEMLELSVPCSVYHVVEGIEIKDMLEVDRLNWYSEQVLPQIETQEGIKCLFNKTISSNGDKFETQFMSVLLYLLYIVKFVRTGATESNSVLNRLMLFISWMLISNDRESSIECTI